ncbi:hypothetical protein D3C87_1428090 [compost metagenome]
MIFAAKPSTQKDVNYVATDQFIEPRLCFGTRSENATGDHCRLYKRLENEPLGQTSHRVSNVKRASSQPSLRFGERHAQDAQLSKLWPETPIIKGVC